MQRYRSRSRLQGRSEMLSYQVAPAHLTARGEKPEVSMGFTGRCREALLGPSIHQAEPLDGQARPDMKAFLIGLVVGCAICSVAWPLGYSASLNSGAVWSAPAASASIVLWPTSLMLMAFQPTSSPLFSVRIFVRRRPA